MSTPTIEPSAAVIAAREALASDDPFAVLRRYRRATNFLAAAQVLGAVFRIGGGRWSDVLGRRVVLVVTVAVALLSFGATAWDVAAQARRDVPQDTVGADRVMLVGAASPPGSSSPQPAASQAAGSSSSPTPRAGSAPTWKVSRSAGDGSVEAGSPQRTPGRSRAPGPAGKASHVRRCRRQQGPYQSSARPTRSAAWITRGATAATSSACMATTPTLASAGRSRRMTGAAMPQAPVCSSPALLANPAARAALTGLRSPSLQGRPARIARPSAPISAGCREPTR